MENYQPLITTPYLPQRGKNTARYIPRKVDVPPGKIRSLIFTFAALTQLQTDQVQWPFDSTFLLLSLTGNYVNANDAAGFRVQLTHTHEQATRPLFQKPMLNSMVLGSAQRPFICRTPYVFLQGDSLLVEVKNLSTPQTQAGANATSRVEVVLHGTEIDS